jgi:hypothetical protein
MEFSALLMANCRAHGGRGTCAMLDVMVLRGALRAFSAMFGSFGVFFTYLSFLKPSLGMYAVLFITTAMATLWSATEK